MTEDDQPPSEPEKPKRLSFREANLGPEHRPEPPVRSQSFFSKRKRSVTIGLLAVGASAAAIYGITHHNANCDQVPPDQAAACRQHSGSGGGGRYFGGSSGGSTSDAHSVSRGGFGGSGSAHGSGGE